LGGCVCVWSGGGGWGGGEGGKRRGGVGGGGEGEKGRKKCEQIKRNRPVLGMGWSMVRIFQKMA